MVPRQEITAWRAPVAGISEVFHARFVEHAYPPHTHDTWTLLGTSPGRYAPARLPLR